MNYDEELLSIIRNYKYDLQRRYDSFIASHNTNKKLVSNWKLEKEKIENKLKKILDSIDNEHYSLLLKLAIKYYGSSQKNTTQYTNPKRANFDKFLFYVDSLNGVAFSKEILKYNPNYCEKVINKIAFEYALLLDFLSKTLNDKKSSLENEFRSKGLEFLSDWEKFYKSQVSHLAEQKANSIINNIIQSI